MYSYKMNPIAFYKKEKDKAKMKKIFEKDYHLLYNYHKSR